MSKEVTEESIKASYFPDPSVFSDDSIGSAQRALYANYRSGDFDDAEPETKANITRDVLAVLNAVRVGEKFSPLHTSEDLEACKPGSWAVGDNHSGVFKKLTVVAGGDYSWFSLKKDQLVPDCDVLPATLMYGEK